MNIKAFEQEMTRAAIFAMAVELIAFVIVMWVLYIVIKSAIRDGIKESGLVRTWATEVHSAKHKTDLPEMKAER